MKNHYEFVAALLWVVSASAIAENRIINGDVIPPEDAPQIIRVEVKNGACTGMIVGPRVIATAAHCTEDGSIATFKLLGATYTAKMTISPSHSFPSGTDHDIALGLVDREIDQLMPISIGARVDLGDEVEIFGFGCTKPGGGGGNDGSLRRGITSVVGRSGEDFFTRSNAAVCFGDSGGPAMVGGEAVGVASKGDIKTISYFADLTSITSRKFLESFTQTQNVEICGVNSTCN